MNCRRWWLFAGLSLLLAPMVIAEPITGYLGLGVGYLDDDNHRFGRYSGLLEEGSQGWLDFRVESLPDWQSDATHYWRLSGRELGRDTTQLGAEWGQRGSQSLTLDYRELAWYRFDDGASPFQQVAENHWVLPANWQVTGNTTDTMANLSAHLAPVAIGTQREQLGLSYERVLTNAWDVQVSVARDDKTGNRPWGAMIGTNGGNSRAAILPTQVDYQTDTLNLSARYGVSGTSLAVAYYGSFFRNRADAVSWQNPFGQQPQWTGGVGYPDGQGQLALEPDNQFHQLRVTGSHVFSPQTRASGDISVGRMTQNDDFLPYTNNPNLAVTVPLPSQSLDGEIHTTTANLRWVTRPLRPLQLSASYQLDDRENRTPRRAFVPVVGDAADQLNPADAYVNRPYSYRKQSGALAGNYRFAPRIRGSVGYEQVQIDRDYAEVNHSRERILSAGISVRHWRNVSVSLDYQTSDREGESYQDNRPLQQGRLPGAVAEDDFENHPLLRRYYLADRQRDRWQLRGDWFVNQAWSVGLSVSHSEDDYGELFGLNETRVRSATLDASWVPSTHWQLSGFISADDYRQSQSSRAYTAAPGQAFDPDRNWWASGEDRFTSGQLALSYSGLEQRLAVLARHQLTDVNLGMEWHYSRSVGEVTTRTADALISAPLPDLQTRWSQWQIYGEFTVARVNYFKLSLLRDDYNSDDFALDGINPDTVANALLLGEQTPRYASYWLSLNYRRYFP